MYLSKAPGEGGSAERSQDVAPRFTVPVNWSAEQKADNEAARRRMIDDYYRTEAAEYGMTGSQFEDAVKAKGFKNIPDYLAYVAKTQAGAQTQPQKYAVPVTVKPAPSTGTGALITIGALALLLI